MTMIKLFFSIFLFKFVVAQPRQECFENSFCEYAGCFTTTGQNNPNLQYGCNCMQGETSGYSVYPPNIYPIECNYCYTQVGWTYEDGIIYEYCPPRPCDEHCQPGYTLGNCYCVACAPGTYCLGGMWWESSVFF